MQHLFFKLFAGFPLTSTVWGRPPASVTPTGPGSSDVSQTVSTPLGASHLSPLGTLQSLDTIPQSGVLGSTSQTVLTGGSDMNINILVPSSGFQTSSFHSSSLPPYSSGLVVTSNMHQNITTLAGVNNSNNSNSGMSSQRLCQLLTQNSTPESMHSSVTTDGRRAIVGRGRRASGQIGSVSTPNSVSSSSSGISTSAGGTAGLTMNMHWSSSSKSIMKSPDDHLYQSPTEGPGQSPQEKPQSTSEDGEMEITNVTGIDSSISISNSKNINTQPIGSGVNNSNNKTNINAGGGGGRGNDRSNHILKSLLSQEDDDEPSLSDHGNTSPLISSVSVGHTLGSKEFATTGDKNEAEPRRTNALLKVLMCVGVSDCVGGSECVWFSVYCLFKKKFPMSTFKRINLKAWLVG